jgi:enoyl-CoA hydratase/carnithine racemase
LTQQKLRVQSQDGVLTLTLDRPPVNALDTALLQSLMDVFEGEAGGPEVRAVVIAGAGRAFIAGADIRSFAEHDASSGPHPSMRLGNDLLNLIEAYPKPVVAAVNGACLGGGSELALACDFRIASSAATFGQPEIKLGLVPAWGAIQRLPRLIGRGHAVDLLLTGRTVDAEEALRMGLVHEVVAPDALLARAMELARSLAGMAPLAMAATKERLARGAGERQGQAIRDDEWAFNDLLGSEDAREGLRAFLEKRAPDWRGR